MKRIIAFVLSVLTVLSVCSFSLTVNAEETAKEELFASTISFDNSETQRFSSEGATLEYVKITHPGFKCEDDVNAEHRDWFEYYAKVTGEGNYSFTLDVSDMDFSEHNAAFVVVDTRLTFDAKELSFDTSKLSVAPILKNGEIGETAQYVPYNGAGYFRFKNAADISGVKISMLEAGETLTLSELFICENEYSAKYMVDNNVLPSKATPKRMIIHEDGQYTAISLANVGREYRDVSKGGIYFDYTNCKWPSIVVDENDKLYVIASGCREGHHDGFSAVVMTTSEDGGKSWSVPKQISNTMCDDRDTGLVYLGDGRFVASSLTHGLKNHLKGGEFYDIVNNPYPVGDVNKTYQKIIEYVYENDFENCCYDDASYVVMSNDYGKTWNVTPYTLPGVEGVDYTEAMGNTAYNYQYNYMGVKAPIMSPHGPRKLNDDTLLWVGEAVDTTYVGWREKAVYGSSDGGYTWNFLCKLPIPCDYHEGDFPEPDITETKDGVVVCALRSFTLFTCMSYDKGRTWTTPNNVRNTADNEPLIGVSHGISTMANGDIVLTTARRNYYEGGICWVYAYVSEDGGRTWSELAKFDKALPASDFGYPGNAELSDGTIVTCYYYGSDISTFNWTYELVEAQANSWIKTKDGWRYYDENVKPVTKNWVKDSSGECYLDKNGYLVTGTSLKDGKTYVLLDDNGHKVTKKTGWVKVSSGWYYLQSGGTLKTNCWMKDSKGWCFLSGNGLMKTATSVMDSKGWCLVDAGGYWVTKPGWQKAGGNWYYVQKDGYLKCGGWMKDSKGWCYLSSSGLMETNKVIEDSKGFCFVDASGYWITREGWQQYGSDWVYVLKGGYLKTNGWMKDSKGWCYLDNNGIMLTSTAVKDTKGWCIIDEGGYWLTAEGKYYVRSSMGGVLTPNYYNVGKDGYIVIK